MVDAAIGGKNGVNTPLGKNMVGTVYFPEKTIIDLHFLKTLPEKELWNGKVEMLKAGLVADPGLFASPDIECAIEVKRKLVFEDPYEKGKRRLLNFGHTIGHALEKLSDYKIPHGEAVATGIVLESRLAYALDILDLPSLEQIEAAFPPPILAYDPTEVIRAMQLDKKSSKGTPRFVLLEKIGKPLACGGEYCASVPEPTLLRVLHDATMHACKG
jgi:3-dehydroquinate synthase